MNDKELIDSLKNKILSGSELDEAEVYALSEVTDSETLREASAELTRRLGSGRFESCSIVNARSGLCSENCKWCAQSAQYSTGCRTYDMVDEAECMETAGSNARRGVERFSLVASGKAVRGKSLERICHLLKKVKDNTGIKTCASLGLLDREGLRALKDAGVTRYHCNIETAPSYFPTLCTTHTVEDKFKTIEAAREAGLDICSGGIIGMGETRRQRAEFALALRRARPCSIPLNILSPIPGTPLQDIELISFDEILDTIAIFRFAHPHTELRFAGGRMRFERGQQLEMLRVGINGGIVGTLLTTTASEYDADKDLAYSAGLKF